MRICRKRRGEAKRKSPGKAPQNIEVSGRRTLIWYVGLFLYMGEMGFIAGWVTYFIFTDMIMIAEFYVYRKRLNNFPATAYREPQYLKQIFPFYYFYDSRQPKVVIQCIYAHITVFMLYGLFMGVTIFMLRNGVDNCEEIFWREIDYYLVINLLLGIVFYIKSKIEEL